MGGAPVTKEEDAKAMAYPINTSGRLAKLRQLFSEQSDGGIDA